MKAFMTIGTIDFLQKLAAKHEDIHFHLMNSSEGSLAYYEDEPKNIFSSGRAYEVVIQSGLLEEEGYVVMNNIPVTDDGRAIFEERFKDRQNAVDKLPGFQAFRFLRPTKGDTYVVLTQWRSKADFENWKNSEAFKKAHKGTSTKPPAYFPNKPFITTYHMHDPEEDED
ncbi:antibiotic biosynthesis monooxygenase [Virgibacillus sp. NKC19-16]|uniref:antibiotic biosynthesis monooxygenase family protein n=1 Tax=Virgibacillus salidurans TaxID=2831673 RepID=UPI001F32FD5F|nr:antibiotic biosynthesis monooxygenase [Virgibacillus sp. NKC19-16]UJL47583.1 antibiotic biosynthesis monooxygenase [Virgibacillus sp. NKC19-16]